MKAVAVLPQVEEKAEAPKPKPARDTRVKFTLYIPPDVHKRLKDHAHERDVKMQPMLEEAIDRWMRSQGLKGWTRDDG